jgi:hypothetical protein
MDALVKSFTPSRLLLAVIIGASLAGCVFDYGTAGPVAVAEHATVKVSAAEAWNDTGVDLSPGDRLILDYASGEWSPWPGGSYDAIGYGGDPRCDCNVLQGVSHAALLAQVGEAEPIFVGKHYAHVVGEGGRLYLGINDTRLEDNSGWIFVRLEVWR